MSKAVAEGFQVLPTHELFLPLDVGSAGHDRAFYHGEQKEKHSKGTCARDSRTYNARAVLGAAFTPQHLVAPTQRESSLKRLKLSKSANGKGGPLAPFSSRAKSNLLE